uniref:JmjC domain-containing protein n=1 Tax=Octactis speculum TaxID=3111310 RepID=A0A7S2BGH3_9STRA|mmetsp:Transcript_23036/g.31525  ORF Transcript_23036/g.31525 Transcript_23036/m.31525 type:complete len:563 (+) Transcript_23036:138-1826(+)
MTEVKRHWGDEITQSHGAGAGPSKRRRRAPTSYNDEVIDLDNEHLKLVQQAVENSRAENINVDVEIEEAPVFYPTVDEFRDPIKFIASISAKARPFGICRIVPPDGWKTPAQLPVSSDKTFPTRRQRMDMMQEGRSMSEGKRYTAATYKQMADEFHAKWVASRYQNDPISATGPALEKDYWKLVRGADGEEVEVEYGNDLSTVDYWSGFPMRQPADPELGSKTRIPQFGSEEYCRVSGWNLNNVSFWPGSALRYLTHSIDGINRPWLYLGMLFSSFCWHREDIYLASMNFLHFGAPKQWYGIPGNKATKFSSTMEKIMKLRIKEVPDLEHHITTQISPAVLLGNGVPVYKTTQEAGQFIVTFPEAYHAGFSYGFNCGEAVNVATVDWIDHGMQSVSDYRNNRKKEVFSFDRLMFTLSYHLDEVKLDACQMLVRQLESLHNDEEYFRQLLYDSGVQNVTLVAELPDEGKMSSEINEVAASYDDQRMCSSCQHTCFLSAVCCSCSERDVACLRCCDVMCGCPRTNKFILEWHSVSEIQDVIQKVRVHVSSFENGPELGAAKARP